MNINRLHVSNNPFQGIRKKVLCVCSAGLLRSPTAAVVLSQEPYNFNTRAVGVDIGHALIPIDDVLLHWADEVLVMDSRMENIVNQMIKEADIGVPKVFNLEIDDIYEYMNISLQELIKGSYEQVSK